MERFLTCLKSCQLPTTVPAELSQRSEIEPEAPDCLRPLLLNNTLEKYLAYAFRLLGSLYLIYIYCALD